MKCDELKVYVKPLKTSMLGKTIVGQPYYLKSYVDAAFDELKAKLAEKDKEIAELKEQYKDMDVTHTVHIAKMNARIEELEDNVDFWKKENRRLKRALWLARAKRAFAEYFFWNHIAFDKKYAKNKFTISHSNSTNSKSNKVSRTPREWSDIWYDVEFKCNAYADKLAKEYK